VSPGETKHRECTNDLSPPRFGVPWDRSENRVGICACQSRRGPLASISSGPLVMVGPPQRTALAARLGFAPKFSRIHTRQANVDDIKGG
jgi:hypothetical protein